MNSQISTNVPSLAVNLSEVPALLDYKGVNRYLAPLGRTLLYELASSGEIETASIGMKRGKRVFVTASVVRWLERRMAATQRPQMADQRGTSRRHRGTSANLTMEEIGR